MGARAWTRVILARNVIAVVILLQTGGWGEGGWEYRRGENKFSSVRSYLISLSQGGSISFNNNNPANFSYDQKCMQQRKWQIWRNLSKIWRKFKDVRRCPLKSDEWRKRQIGKKDKFGENWKVMSKGVSWKVVILTKNGKFGENDEFAILVTSPCLPFSSKSPLLKGSLWTSHKKFSHIFGEFRQIRHFPRGLFAILFGT